MSRHVYTEEEKQFLKEFIPGHMRKEIQEAFNNRFGCDISVGAVKAYMAHHKIRNGIVKVFPKGHTPANKGKKMADSKTRKPVGTEYVDPNGYIKVKIAEPDKWAPKQRYVWEKINGQVPDGYVVAFRDNNNQNMEINNLMLISKAERLVMNQFYNKCPGEMKDTALLLADLRIATGKRRKEIKNENH